MINPAQNREAARAAYVAAKLHDERAGLLEDGDRLGSTASLHKILEGANTAFARHGVRKTSMSDICEAAGVSRGTLYRYFSTKEELMRAHSEYVSLAFENGVVAAAAEREDPIEKLRAVAGFHLAYSAARQSDHILEAEPSFLADFFQTHFTRHVSAMKTALEPTFDYLEETSGAAVDRELMAEALIRLGLSTLVVPGGARFAHLPDDLVQWVMLRGGVAESPPATAREPAEASG